MLFSGACVPGALPPSQVSLSGGTDGRASTPTTSADRETVLRGTLDPQQLFESQSSRAVDFGAGYRLDLRQDGRTVHGPIAELGVYPLHLERFHTRVGLRNIGEMLFDDTRDGAPGWAYTLAASGELTGFFSGADVDGRRGELAAYAAHGEVGFGVFAGITHRSLGGEQSELFIAGLSARLPAAAFFYACGKCLTELH